MYLQRLNVLKKQKQELEVKLAHIIASIEKCKSKIDLLSKFKKIYIESACVSRDKLKISIESLVSDGLNSIHEHKFQFKIIDSIRFGKSGCVFKLEKNGKLAGLRCYGGGIRNIIATILRFIFAEYSIPKTNLPLILDEIGYNLSDNYQDKFGNLLQLFSKKFGRQIILITHEPRITQYADKIFIISNMDNKSYVEERHGQ